MKMCDFDHKMFIIKIIKHVNIKRNYHVIVICFARAYNLNGSLMKPETSESEKFCQRNMSLVYFKMFRSP